MSLLDLPNEIWIKIFSNLDQRELLNVSLVSKKARELALHPALWTKLQLHLDELNGCNLETYQGCNFVA
jgi:hypothetical protein